jgi:ubiquinone/menaquinone biosynthesis C-methylase UbiE
MKADKKHRLCPVERAGALDFILRKWIHDPKKILQPYVKEGMTALDLGCGPGFFTIEMARLAGKTGRVIAADLQEGMLAKLKAKIQGSEWANRITLHQCQPERIALSASCDFILIFYMLHEVSAPAAFLKEIRSLLKPGGKVLIAEPKWHVSAADFLQSVAIMKQAGFEVLTEPKILFSRTIVVQ